MIKPKLILPFIFLLISSAVFGSDHYKIGDKLYIWARNGINLRKGPGTKYTVIKSLAFGDSVIILDSCRETYNVNAIPSATFIQDPKQVADPLILKGHWVKVTIDTMHTGYVIDQYLLPLKPVNIFSQFVFEDNFFQIRSVDTTYDNPIELHGNKSRYCIQVNYDLGITRFSCKGEQESGYDYQFPGFSIEEVIVFFNNAYNNFLDCYVLKNWKDNLVFQESTCTWTIRTKDNITSVSMECHC